MKNPTVGAQLPSYSVTLTHKHIRRYAQASGDANPIHLDDEAARSAGLPGVIAHGMLPMGQLASLVTQWAGRAGRIRRIAVRFAGTVFPGDTITFHGRVRSLVDGVVDVAVDGVNQRGEPVLTQGQVRFSVSADPPD
ncbi:acyl dehydratase [Rhodococcus sp. WS4]|nr:acyl dehydratase [Rhodococcus sp. WS4]